MSAIQKVETPEGPVVRMQELSPEYQEIMVLGGVLQRSGYFKDVRDQAQAVTKILFGRELGISPINSMSGIHIIEGKPALSSNLLAALIKRSGKYDYRIRMSTDADCKIMFLQKVGDAWEELGLSEFSMEDAKRAGVIRDGGSWKKYPKAMLFARALSQGARMFCPDVSISAIYVPEELGAQVNESGEVASLPESRGPLNVERTTEPIPISSPVKVTAQDEIPRAEPSPVQASEAREEEPQPALQPPPSREPGSDDEDECIDLPRQRALHRAFKDAIMNEPTKKAADSWLRAWLKDQGYVDVFGQGTTKTIPMTLFDEVKANAVKFASELK